MVSSMTFRGLNSEPLHGRVWGGTSHHGRPQELLPDMGHTPQQLDFLCRVRHWLVSQVRRIPAEAGRRVVSKESGRDRSNPQRFPLRRTVPSLKTQEPSARLTGPNDVY